RQYRPTEYDRHSIGVVNGKPVGGGGARNRRGGGEGAVRGAAGDFRRKVHPSAARRDDCRLIQRRDSDDAFKGVIGGEDFRNIPPEIRFNENVLFQAQVTGGWEWTVQILA